MFIAVLPYKKLYYNITDNKVLILDTEDMSVEYASIDELISSDIYVESESLKNGRNGYFYTYASLASCRPNVSTEALRFWEEEHSTEYLLDSNVRVTIKYKLEHRRLKYLYINCIKIAEVTAIYVSYIFRYKNYYIFRIKTDAVSVNGSAKDIGWLSVAIDDTGKVVEFWDITYTLYKENRGFGVQVDLLFGGY